MRSKVLEAILLEKTSYAPLQPIECATFFAREFPTGFTVVIFRPAERRLDRNEVRQEFVNVIFEEARTLERAPVNPVSLTGSIVASKTFSCSSSCRRLIL